MKIATGASESHEATLPLDASATPGVVPPTRGFPGTPEQLPARDLTGERLADLGASEAECGAAQTAGLAADAARRTFYEGDIKPLAAEYGLEMALPDVTSDQSKHTGSAGVA